MRNIAIAAALLLATAPVSAAAAAELDVVASFSILGDMVQRIGGDRVAVTIIVGPDADTHVYEPKPGDAAALAGADLFVVNGLGFEGWMERLVEATGYAGPVAVASTGVTAHEMAEEGDDHADHDDHDEHDHGGLDPHAWQDLQNGILYAKNIAAALCAADAEGCDAYGASAAAYEAELAALDAEVRARFAALPAAARKIITTHDAFGYFGAAYGVTFLAPEGISTDAEPSAAMVAQLIRQIRAEGVKALFIENMSDGRLVQQIAAETGATLGGTLYADALSPADGPAPTYLDMFAYNVNQMLPAMGGQ